MKTLSRLALLLALLLLVPACGGGSTAAPAPQPSTIAYVGLGASDAVGIGAFPLSNGYVYVLAEDMESVADTVSLTNLGINGARIGEIIADELPDAIDADPDVVSLWTGANDLIGGDDPDDFASALDALLGALDTQTDAQVFVADLPDLTQAPLFQLSPDPDVTEDRIAAFNARIAQAAQAHGFRLVRLSAMAPSNDLFFLDGFHPNNAGHAKIAEAFWTEMAPRIQSTGD
jgi:lysophospholipase L1-like esterase